MAFSSGRRFRIWDYNISHNQMLIRSPIAPGPDEEINNIDIIFWGVEFVGVPSSMQGVELARRAPVEDSRGEGPTGVNRGYGSAFNLTSGGETFVVVALGYKVLSNTMDIFDSSLEYFAGTDADRKLGEVLDHSAWSESPTIGAERV